MGAPVIDLLDAVWISIAALGDALDDDQWQRPTDCPGWSVKDNLSHMIGTERMLLGASADPPIAQRGDHVRNDIGAFNENAVEARRSRSGNDVLAEFREVTAARLDALRALPAEKWEAIGPTPTGPNTYRHFMTMRAFDCWVHEQDMRRAVGMPGHLTGPVVASALAWHRRNIGYVVGKLAKVPEGVAVAFDVTGDEGEHVVVQVRDGRAAVTDDSTVSPQAVLQLDVETYNAVLCGRWNAADAIANGKLRISGDDALGLQVANAMGYVF